MVEIILRCDEERCGAWLPVRFCKPEETWGEALAWFRSRGWAVDTRLSVRCPRHSGIEDPMSVLLAGMPIPLDTGPEVGCSLETEMQHAPTQPVLSLKGQSDLAVGVEYAIAEFMKSVAEAFLHAVEADDERLAAEQGGPEPPAV